VTKRSSSLKRPGWCLHDVRESPTTALLEKWEMKVLLPAPVIPITAMTVSSGLGGLSVWWSMVRRKQFEFLRGAHFTKGAPASSGSLSSAARGAPFGMVDACGGFPSPSRVSELFQPAMLMSLN